MAHESALSHFVTRGYRLGGVVHVGANDAEEFEWYCDNMLWPILLIDPLQEAAQRFHSRHGHPDGVRFIVEALGGYTGTIGMTIPKDGDDEKASAMVSIRTPGHAWTEVEPGKTIGVPITRFDELVHRAAIDVTVYNTLVVDVQGMEMQALEGFGDLLPAFDFLCIELSAKPLYNGEVDAQTVVDYLAARRYVRVTDIVEHGDVLFLKEWLT